MVVVVAPFATKGLIEHKCHLRKAWGYAPCTSIEPIFDSFERHSIPVEGSDFMTFSWVRARGFEIPRKIGDTYEAVFFRNLWAG